VKGLLEPDGGMCNPYSAETFAEFFDGKVSDIRSRTAVLASPLNVSRDVSMLTNFESCIPEEVARMTQKAPNKHGELDPAPTWLVEQCSVVLAPVIALLTNRSLQEAGFPEVAIVKPFLKNLNLDLFDSKLWRPISNIGFVSKIVKRHAIRRSNHHVSTHNLLPRYQLAYRPHYSTDTAISVVFN
jgi:hypothetical protein